MFGQKFYINHLQPYEQNNMEGIIEIYLSNSIYGDLTKWLYTFDEFSYEEIDIFSLR
jgi:hypothetical protein